MLIDTREQLAACVGKTVTLRGTVSRTKSPEILGVEIDSTGDDLADQLAEATGVLATYVIPQDIDADGLHSAHKSPGTYYVLQVDGGLAKPRAAR